MIIHVSSGLTAKPTPGMLFEFEAVVNAAKEKVTVQRLSALCYTGEDGPAIGIANGTNHYKDSLEDLLQGLLDVGLEANPKVLEQMVNKALAGYFLKILPDQVLIEELVGGPPKPLKIGDLAHVDLTLTFNPSRGEVKVQISDLVVHCVMGGNDTLEARPYEGMARNEVLKITHAVRMGGINYDLENLLNMLTSALTDHFLTIPEMVGT